MLQFSIRTLLLVAVVVAIGCAALIHPTEMWRQAIVTMTILIIMISTLAAIFGHGNVRASAGGFAVAGWLYFLLAFSPSLSIREHLLTSKGLDMLEHVVLGESERSVNTIPFMPDGRQLVTGTGNSTIRLWDLSTRNSNFRNIGHALWTLTFGMIGSFVAGWFSQRPIHQEQLNGQSLNPDG